MKSTKLTLTDTLPLTCTRTGICCHGKAVWLNPWELMQLAEAKSMTPRAFRDRYCDFGGILLRFDGPPGFKGLAACSQYLPDCGCSVHTGRPLACRLFPLGRERCGKEFRFMHRGTVFPCIDGCKEVALLPHLTVADYLAGQDIKACDAAQNGYLELMEQLADGAFALLFETGLAATGDRLTLRLWRQSGIDRPEQLAKRLGPEWIDRLIVPDLSDGSDDPAAFAHRHHNLLQSQTQEAFGAPPDATAMSAASGTMMGMALFLGRGLGVNPEELVDRWIAKARELGAA